MTRGFFFCRAGISLERSRGESPPPRVPRPEEPRWQRPELAKAYEPHAVENKWYDFWLEKDYFKLPSQEPRPGAPAFCITIPPPTSPAPCTWATPFSTASTTASRAGSGCGASRVLVVPGTDHAAISTNMKVEQKLAEEGLTRHELGREKFLERCWEWTYHYGGQIIEQLKALGCSYDWDRTRFTLDEAYYRAVLTAFVRFYELGWVYRGHRVVNWCPTCSSTVSDLEVEHVAHSGHFWHIKYPLEGEESYLDRGHHPPRNHARRYRRRRQFQGPALSAPAWKEGEAAPSRPPNSGHYR